MTLIFKTNYYFFFGKKISLYFSFVTQLNKQFYEMINTGLGKDQIMK